MRDIKYRVWNPDLKEMYILSKKEYLGGTGIYDDSVGHDKSVWMQYTGLKDRNGREIYEGDIVKARDVKVNGQDKFYICEVKWMPTGWYAMSYKDLVGAEHYLNLNILETEVIGNIYENPELLEAKGNEHIPNQN